MLQQKKELANRLMQLSSVTAHIYSSDFISYYNCDVVHCSDSVLILWNFAPLWWVSFVLYDARFLKMVKFYVGHQNCALVLITKTAGYKWER